MDTLARNVDTALDRLGVRSGEEVAILVDSDTEAVVWQAFFSAARARGTDPTVLVMATRPANGLEPTRAAADGLARAEVVLALTTASATHTKALKQAATNGARVCSLPGLTLDILTAPVMSPDYGEMERLALRLGELFAAGRQMEITTAKGTRLRIGIGGWERMPILDIGVLVAGAIGNLPAGEVLIVPWEGDSDGVAVIDLAVSTYPKPLEDPVTLEFKGGELTRVRDGEAGRSIEALIEKSGPTARNVAEIAIGINPHARNTGVLIETEKQFGTAHIGIGNSANIGGKVWAPIHIDVIFDRPTISIDGREILRDREFQPAALRKEAYADQAPLGGALRMDDANALTKDGKLFRRWVDAQAVVRESQVGDDETASRAAALSRRLGSRAELTADDRKVAAVMELYGLVRRAT